MMELMIVAVAIYALVDPRTKIVRYIGQSTRPQKRWHQHVHLQTEQSAEKRAWIEELKALGLEPVLCILEWSDSTSCNQREKAWIDHAKAEGWPLLNVYGVQKRYLTKARVR